MKNVLVTGSSGYIGREVCDLLRKNDYKPIEYDLEEGEDLRRPYHNYFGHNFNTVIHLAALIDNPKSIEDPWNYYDNNIRCTLNVIDAMKPGDRLIFSSTAAVYGTPWDHHHSISESDPLKPATPYAQSKVMCEQIIQDCCKVRGIEYVIFRYFNVAGKKNPNRKALIPAVIDALKNDRPIEVYGHSWPTHDCTAVRDYIHVEDVARAHLCAINTLGTIGAMNIGSGCGWSVAEVIDRAEMVTGKAAQVEVKPARAGDIPAIYADVKYAQIAMAFNVKRSLDDMIRSEWEAAQ